MASIQTTQSPQTTYTTQRPKPNYNWASVQLNLIMLPVGLSILLTISLIAVFCHCLRKKKLKIMAKRRRHQKTPKTVYSIHSNGTSKVPIFSHSPVRCESLEPHREEPPSLVHPAKVRKKKRKLNQPLDSNENFVNTEKKRKGSTKSTTSSSGRPLSREKHRKGKVTPERRKSGIPVPINTKKTVQERRLVENERAHNVIRHSSFENNMAVIDRNDPYTIDMDTVRSSRERRRWEIPTAQSIEYDPQRSLRLPPLLELRTVTTA